MAAKLARSKTTGDVKDVAFRMVHISSCCFLSAPSWLSTGWALLKKSRRLSKRLSFASSFFQLQRLSSERTQVRHRLSNRVLSSLRFADQKSLTRSVASFWTPHSKRHGSSGRAEGTTGLPRRIECAGQRQLLHSRSSDVLESSETRHQFQAEFVKRPFRRGGHSLATDDHPLPKRLLSGRQSKVLQRPREVEEGEQPKATDVEPEPEGHDEAQAESEVKKDKRPKSENTKSKSLGSNPKAAHELARAQLQKGYYRPERLMIRVGFVFQPYSILRCMAAYSVDGTLVFLALHVGCLVRLFLLGR